MMKVGGLEVNQYLVPSCKRTMFGLVR